MLSAAAGQKGAMPALLRGPCVGSQSLTAGQSAPGMTAHHPPGARRLLRAAPAAMAVAAAAAAVGARQAQDQIAVVGVKAVGNERARYTDPHLAKESLDAQQRLCEFLHVVAHRAFAT